MSRSLGGLAVPPIGLGCMSLSGVYGAADDAESELLIRHAVDAGATHLDSSDMYGWGHNEEVIGRALKGIRDRVILATKFGQVRRDGQPNGVNGHPDYVQASCEASLKRLGVEVIDLYYQHRVDPAVPIEDTVGAMARLITQGKVRYLGLSEAAPDTIRRAHATHPIAAVQTEFSLLYRDAADATREVTRPLGIGFVAYAPLGRGLFTGTLRSFADIDGRRAAHPRFQEANFDANRAVAARLEAIAATRAAPPPSSRWPGSSPRATTSSPSPARATPRGSTRTSAPARSICRRPISPPSRRRRRRGPRWAPLPRRRDGGGADLRRR